MATKESAFGANAWLVDEMYERYRADPSSVAESWQEFFEDYKPADGSGAPEKAAPPPPVEAEATRAPAPAPPRAEAPAAPDVASATKLSGAAARTAINMAESLHVPTATSTRVVPARLLEVNRRIVNRYLGRTGGGKVSFTHL